MSSSCQAVIVGHSPILEGSLVQAFASFNEAAASLERSYGQLHAEVIRLRRELEETNRDLSHSLEENQHMRQHLNRILEALPCGVLVIEEDGAVSTANPAAQRMINLEKVDPYGAQIPGWARNLFDCVTAGDTERTFQSPASTWLSIRRGELSEEDRHRSVFIVRDISESKRLEQMEEALRRRQALAEMSAVLAHEIRNPLGSMELLAALLADSPLNSECQQWVRHMQAGLRLLAATVNNVLQFHSQAQPELVPTDLGQLLKTVEQFLTPLAQRSNVTMLIENSLDNIRVAGDRNRLAQVLFNLSLNAFRFMPDGGELNIKGQLQEDKPSCAVIAVTDTGPGICTTHLNKIFEAGFTTRPGSPGLGLAVCKAIMDQHAAKISVASAVGKGTTFTLEFPLGEKTDEWRSGS